MLTSAKLLTHAGLEQGQASTEAVEAASKFAEELETSQDLNSVTIPEGAVEKSISHQTWLKKLHHLAFSSTQGHTAELPPEREEN